MSTALSSRNETMPAAKSGPIPRPSSESAAAVVSTWITTKSFSGLLLLVVVVAVSSAIWYPFFKIFEKQKLEEEAGLVKATDK